MRHRKTGRILGRTSDQRKALMKNLNISLIDHELIKTTLPKAKEMRRHFEPLITLAKKDTVANRRLAFARLGNKAAVKKLFEVLGARYKDRQGGYVRVIKCGFRVSDCAPIAYVELVDRPEPVEAEEAEQAPKASKAKDDAKATESKPEAKKAAPKKETSKKAAAAKKTTPKKESAKKAPAAKKETSK